MRRIIQISIFIFLLMLSCSKDSVGSSGTNSGNGNGNGDDNGDSTSANMQPTGSSANDLLSDAEFTQLVIELAHVEGFAPTNATIDNFIAFVSDRVYKPNGITLVMNPIPSSGIDNLSIQDIVAIEDANRNQYNNGNQIAIWAFFTDGASASNSNNGVVLGTAYRNTSFVIFEETIRSLSDSPLEPNRTVLESTVVWHEMGHLFGLTNLGTPLQSDHEDQDHPKHCDIAECLMYFSAETSFGIENLVGVGSPPNLDAQCIADLQANGGK